MFYTFNEYGRYAGRSGTEAERTTTVAPREQTDEYVWNHEDWVFAPNVPRAPIQATAPELITAPAESTKVSPVEFKLLFTPQERVAMKVARAADPVIEDFYDIVEDQRLTHVDLGLQSTKDALAYMVSQELLTAARREEIMLGKVQ